MKGKIMKSTSLKAKILSKLMEGSEYSPKQFGAMYKVAATTVAARVSELRHKAGIAVYANTRTDSNGRTKTFYRVGTPSRAVVAAGYQALAAAS